MLEHRRENYPIRTAFSVEKFEGFYDLCDRLYGYRFELRNIRHSESKKKTIFVDVVINANTPQEVDNGYNDLKRFLVLLNDTGKLDKEVEEERCNEDKEV